MDGQTGRQAWVELERSYQPTDHAIELADPDTLEDLVVELLGKSGSRAHG
jgi:hypothetical protein